jgi:hypothetical protein
MEKCWRDEFDTVASNGTIAAVFIDGRQEFLKSISGQKWFHGEQGFLKTLRFVAEEHAWTASARHRAPHALPYG